MILVAVAVASVAGLGHGSPSDPPAFVVLLEVPTFCIPRCAF